MPTKPPFRAAKYRGIRKDLRGELRLKLYRQQKGLCHICGEPMAIMRTGVSTKHFATFDHVIPHSKGGTAHYTNLRLAHGRCNSARGSIELEPA